MEYVSQCGTSCLCTLSASAFIEVISDFGLAVPRSAQFKLPQEYNKSMNTVTNQYTPEFTA